MDLKRQYISVDDPDYVDEAAEQWESGQEGGQDPKPSSDDREAILLNTNLYDGNTKTLEVFAKHSDLYQHGTQLVTVDREQSKPKTEKSKQSEIEIIPFTANSFVESASRHINWMKYNHKGKVQKTLLPERSVRAILDRTIFTTIQNIREIKGIVRHPILKPNGSILIKAGYDPETQIFFDKKHEYPGIIDKPSKDDAIRSYETFVEPFCDFVFESDLYKAAHLAMCLTPLARYHFYGPCPMSFVSASVAGEGKGMLINSSLLAAIGQKIEPCAYVHNNEEMEKRLGSKLITGDQKFNFDNISKQFGLPIFDLLLTATKFEGRILGKSKTFKIDDLRLYMVATGNNPQFVGDTARRTIEIRLNSQTENPENRSGFRYPDICKHTKENHPKYCSALLNILSAYCHANKPMGVKSWGSFEEWSEIVLGCVHWITGQDVSETKQVLKESSDLGKAALRQFLHAFDEDGVFTGLTSKEMISTVTKYDEHGHPYDDWKYPAIHAALQELCGDKLDSRRIGNVLRKQIKRVIDGRYLISGDRTGKGTPWQVVVSECSASNECF